MRFVHRLEQVGKRANRFGGSEEQKPSRLQGVMKSRQDFFLQPGLEINQQVAATDEVHARERRVAQEILPSEDDHLPQGFADAVAALLLDEEPTQPLG